MLSPEEYLRRILSQIRPVKPVELALDAPEILGSVLAEPVIARLPVPLFTSAAMDGFAINPAVLNTEEMTLTLPVYGDIPAGLACPPARCDGAYRIMTGAPVPHGADTVIRVEDTDASAGPGPLPTNITFAVNRIKSGSHIRHQGEDITVGERVVEAGIRVGPGALSVAASLGYDRLRVRGPVRVAVISTGSELCDTTQVVQSFQSTERRSVEIGPELAKGTIPDSNSYLLQGLVHQAGGRVVLRLRVRDSAKELLDAYRRAVECEADLVLTSGGISTGAYDVVKEVGLSLGMNFHRLAIKPGKPQGYGCFSEGGHAGVPVIMLPGNPLSAFTSFHLFVGPALAKLGGQTDISAPLSPLAGGRREYGVSAANWVCPANVMQVVPVRISVPQDDSTGDLVTPWVMPLVEGAKSSHRISALVSAEALVVVPDWQTQVRVGDRLEIYRLKW